MRQDTDAANAFRNAQRRLQRKLQQRHRMALALKPAIDRQLSEQRRGQRVGAVALLRLGQKRALDLGGAQSDIAGNQRRLAIKRGVTQRVLVRGDGSTAGS